jgi:hypothetical protein
MVRWRRIIAKLRGLVANKRAEEDLAREVASHLTLLADDFERRGMPWSGLKQFTPARLKFLEIS